MCVSQASTEPLAVLSALELSVARFPSPGSARLNVAERSHVTD